MPLRLLHPLLEEARRFEGNGTCLILHAALTLWQFLPGTITGVRLPIALLNREQNLRGK